MKKFYVYEIVDPRNDKTFYIGKGKNDRMMNHLIPSYIKKNNPKSIKIRDIISDGLEPIFKKAKENLDETEAYNLERKLIENIGLENLTNQCMGGGGGSPPGRVFSDEHRKNISKALTGKKFTDERKRNISKALTGRNISTEQRQTISKTLKGRPLTDEHKKDLEL